MLRIRGGRPSASLPDGMGCRQTRFTRPSNTLVNLLNDQLDRDNTLLLSYPAFYTDFPRLRPHARLHGQAAPAVAQIVQEPTTRLDRSTKSPGRPFSSSAAANHLGVSAACFTAPIHVLRCRD